MMPRMSRILLMVPVMMVIGQTMSQSKNIVPPCDPGIRYSGRWETSDSLHYKYSWPGVYLTAEFTGTSLGVRLADGTNYYNVYIDGRLHSVFHPGDKDEAEYVLAEHLKNSRHTLRLSRRNISFDEIYSFAGLVLDDGASVLPSAANDGRRIEFIGDSFVAAESNEAAAQSLDWKARFPVTNIDKGFAALIARHFNAQYTTTCRSGAGMYCDWQGNTNGSIPERFNRVFMDRAEPQWNFSRWIPNAVVIALGLNDYAGLKNKNGNVSAKKSALFRNHYRQFLSTIRRVYPNVKIVCVAAFAPWVRRQTRRIVNEEQHSGKTDIFYTTYAEFPGVYAAGGHPTVAAHQLIAGQIIKAMESFNLFPGKN